MTFALTRFYRCIETNSHNQNMYQRARFRANTLQDLDKLYEKFFNDGLVSANFDYGEIATIDKAPIHYYDAGGFAPDCEMLTDENGHDKTSEIKDFISTERNYISDDPIWLKLLFAEEAHLRPKTKKKQTYYVIYWADDKGIPSYAVNMTECFEVSTCQDYQLATQVFTKKSEAEAQIERFMKALKEVGPNSAEYHSYYKIPDMLVKDRPFKIFALREKD